MKIEYERPFAEIISFAACERLASQEIHAARDGDNVNVDDSSIGIGEGVEEW